MVCGVSRRRGRQVKTSRGKEPGRVTELGDVLPDDLVERLVGEGLKPASEALRDAGVRVSAWTAMRWCRTGVRGHRLESLKVGGKWMSTEQAVRRFLARTQGSQGGRNKSRGVVTSQAVERFLENLGLGREASAKDRGS